MIKDDENDNKNNDRHSQQQNQKTTILELERRINELENENAKLKLEQKVKATISATKAAAAASTTTEENNNNTSFVGVLNPIQIERYSRQLLLRNGFGIEGQLKLLQAKVLVVGAGGIGSTVLLYLAGCGIGQLTIVDYDNVEISNLHRQIIHSSCRIGLEKTSSAKHALEEFNPTIKVAIINDPITSQNAIDIISSHTCVVDASDNPKTRYIINDACVLCQKTLISGSAIGTEGQLSVYNFNSGPCYRCLYPKPSKGEGCKSCSDNGVLGPVPGLIGTLQAIETIKVITGIGDVMYDRLVMYDSLSCSFMKIKKPPKQVNCPVCGKQPTIKSMEDSERESITARGPTIISTCRNGGNSNNNNDNNKLPSISCTEYYKDIYQNQNNTDETNNNEHILLDVRVKEQYEICSLQGSINIPLEEIQKQQGNLSRIEELSKNYSIPIYCLCRRGIASSEATKILWEKAIKAKAETSLRKNGATATTTSSSASSSSSSNVVIKNIRGGLDAWREHVDTTFPKY